MSNFIKITNKADNIDRRFLEKLGISSKRDDEQTIGQFGSGAKLAPIAALRKGIRWITVARDNDGPYTLEYVARDVDGISTVFYKYDDFEKESSFTVDAGLLSWDEDFQIFREAFANAVDSKDTYTIEMVDEVADYVDGEVSVYLSAVDSLKEVIDNFNKFFLFNRTPIISTEAGSVYHAYDKGVMRLYNKGVLVYERDHADNDSLLSFDWGFANVDLNEERRMKHYWQTESLVRKFFLTLPNDDGIGLKFAKDCIDAEPYEFFKVLDNYSVDEHTSTSQVWGTAWLELFGDKVIPVGPSNVAEIIADNLRASGYRARFVSAPLAQMLYNSGINSPGDVIGDKSNIKVVECPSEHVKVFEHAVRTVARYDARLKEFDVSVMDDPNNFGLAVIGQGKEEIFVSLDCLQLGYRQIVQTLIHELDHVTTGLVDSDYREFRNVADQRIVDLVVDAGYGDDLYVDNRYIGIDLNYLASLGSLEYSVHSSDIGSLLRIGDKTFFVNAVMQNGKGVMQVRDNMLTIEDNAINPKTTIQKV